MTRRHSLLILALAAAAIVAVPLPASAAYPIGLGTGPSAGAQDLLPDLRMADMYDLHLQRKNGELKLRFGTIVWNLGDGPLEARMNGRVGREMTNVRQIIRVGTPRARVPSAICVWALGPEDGNVIVTVLVPLRQGERPVVNFEEGRVKISTPAWTQEILVAEGPLRVAGE